MSETIYSAPRGYMCDVCFDSLDLVTEVTLTPDSKPTFFSGTKERDEQAEARGWSCYVGQRQRRHYCPSCSTKPKSKSMQKVW